MNHFLRLAQHADLHALLQRCQAALDSPVKVYSFAKGRLYRTFFTCAACKAQIETTFDCWSPPHES